MPAPTIDQAFVQHFGADVHEAYQRMGSKLRNTVRNRSFAPGEKTRFQKAGKGTATKKDRHGKVPPMNLPHSYVDLTLEDYYAGEFVDSLDLLKTNIDERQVVANAEAYAHGRNTDEVIMTAFLKATGSGGSTKYNSSTASPFQSGSPLQPTLPLALQETLNAADVPDDGNRFWVVGPKTWNRMMQVDQFVKSDYIGYEALPYKGGMTAKRWLGFFWFVHSGIKVDGTGDERTMLYHRSAVGTGVQKEISTDVTWQGQEQAWFIATSMSLGSCIIDANGAYEVVVDVT